MKSGNVFFTKSQGYLTVYLTLVLTVLLSLCLALIEGARTNAMRLQIETVMDIGLNSILAEYHRELWEQYNLLAIDASYGTEYAVSENTRQHLKRYLEANFSTEDIFLSDFLYRDFLGLSLKNAEVTKVSIFTDDGGGVFRRQAVEAVKEDSGLALLEQLQQWMQTVEEHELSSRDIASEKREVDHEMEEVVEEAEEAEEQAIWEATGEDVSVSIDFENPTTALEQKRRQGILEFTVDNPGALSGRELQTDFLVAARMEENQVSRGNWPVKADVENTLLERFFFQEYLLNYLGYYGAEKEAAALCYQMEYLIAGKENDLDNLLSVANRLCLMREVANAVYLFADEEKCMMAEALANIVAALAGLPELAPLLKVSLLLGWAFAESLYDVRVLLAGGRIPLIKDKDSWHYDLEGALQGTGAIDKEEEGLSYEDYLRIFMMLTDLEVLTKRAMNIIEADIRRTPGNSHFRLDGCYDRIEARAEVQSAYGHQFEITRQKGY